MLDGLDRIPWHRLSTSYGSAEETPYHVRLLLSTNEAERKRGWDYIVFSINHQGAIHDSTVTITPFLIDLLTNKDTPDQALVLSILSSFAESIDEEVYRVGTMGYFSLLAKLYANLLLGVEQYERFLSHPDLEVRKDAIGLLKIMRHKVARTRLRLLQAFRIEPDNWLKSQIVETLVASLPQDWHLNRRLLTHYQRFFENNIVSNEDEDVNAELAIGWILCQSLLLLFTSDAIRPPQIVVEALVDGLFYPDDGYHTELRRMEYLLNLDAELLLEVFSTADIHAYNLHLIARHLMWRAFGRNPQYPLPYRNPIDYLSYSDTLLPPRHALQNMIYKYRDLAPETPPELQQDHPHFPSRSRLMQAIVDRDRFWEMRTNLFSFFFNLPDDRESLRALLYKGQ